MSELKTMSYINLKTSQNRTYIFWINSKCILFSFTIFL